MLVEFDIHFRLKNRARFWNRFFEVQNIKMRNDQLFFREGRIEVWPVVFMSTHKSVSFIFTSVPKESFYGQINIFSETHDIRSAA